MYEFLRYKSDPLCRLNIQVNRSDKIRFISGFYQALHREGGFLIIWEYQMECVILFYFIFFLSHVNLNEQIFV